MQSPACNLPRAISRCPLVDRGANQVMRAIATRSAAILSTFNAQECSKLLYAMEKSQVSPTPNPNSKLSTPCINAHTPTPTPSSLRHA